MIFNTGNPLSPKVYIAINGVEVKYKSIQTMSLSLGTNMHDILVLNMAGIPPRAITDYIDAAVRMTITSGQGRTQEFCGYVLYVEPESDGRSSIVNNSPFQTTRIVCFGASLSMMGKKQRVWEDVSIKSLASDFCDTYHFSLDVLDDGFVLPRLVQSGESDWHFLTRICAKYGYSVTMHGTHMHIWDPFKAIGRRPSFEKLQPVIKTTSPTPGGILKFEGLFGYVTPEGWSTNYQVGVLDSNGVSSTVTSNILNNEESWSGVGKRSKFYSTIVESTQTIVEAEKVIGAKERETFPFTAKVQISAGAGIVPGGIVDVVGYNSNFEGLWYVREVTHSIGGTSYVTDLMLGRDFNTTKTFNIAPVELAQQAPEPKFVAGEWRATSERVNAYV
jgi:phage protein D